MSTLLAGLTTSKGSQKQSGKHSGLPKFKIPRRQTSHRRYQLNDWSPQLRFNSSLMINRLNWIYVIAQINSNNNERQNLNLMSSSVYHIICNDGRSRCCADVHIEILRIFLLRYNLKQKRKSPARSKRIHTHADKRVAWLVISPVCVCVIPAACVGLHDI